MKDVEWKQLAGNRVNRRLLTTGSLVLWGVVAAGCAATGETKPQVTAAVAKSGNTYIVKRAAVRTPAADRLQRNRQQVQRTVGNQQRPETVTVSRSHGQNSSVQLTKAQYHARYQAQQKAAAKAAVERKQAAARALLAKKKAQQQAVRNQHIARWKQQQQKRQQYHQSWQKQQQLAKKKAMLQARKPVAQKQVRKPTVRKTIVAQKRPDPRQKYLLRWERMQAEKRLEAKRAEQRVERVIYNAKKQIGRKYVWGGASPRKGFDCSGLVQHSMNKGANVKVPRTALQQYRASVKVPAHKAERGDLVFFITRGKRVSHVGIYLGDNKFVHAPRTGKRITTSRLRGYWKKRLVGFGRIPGACRLPV